MVFNPVILSSSYTPVDALFLTCAFLLIQHIVLVLNLFILSSPYPPVDACFLPVYSFLSSRLHWFLTCIFSFLLIPQSTMFFNLCILSYPKWFSTCIFLLILKIVLDFNLFILSSPYPPVDSCFYPVYSFLSSRFHWFLTCLFSLLLIFQLTPVFNLCTVFLLIHQIAFDFNLNIPSHSEDCIEF